MAPAVAFRNVLLGNVITSGHYPLHNQSGASSKEQCTRDAQLDRGSPALLGPIKAHGPRRGREVREDTWALRKAVWRRQEHDARLQSRVQLPFLLTAACWEYELKTPYAREECCLVKQEFGKANRYGFMCAVRLWKGELHIPCGRYPTIAALHIGAFREKIADRPLPAGRWAASRDTCDALTNGATHTTAVVCDQVRRVRPPGGPWHRPHHAHAGARDEAVHSKAPPQADSGTWILGALLGENWRQEGAAPLPMHHLICGT